MAGLRQQRRVGRLNRSFARRRFRGYDTELATKRIFRGEATVDAFAQHTHERLQRRAARKYPGDRLWPQKVLRLFKDAVRKVARNEWRGVPRKLRREMWRLMNNKLRDSNNRAVRVRPRHRLVLVTLMSKAVAGTLRMEPAIA